MKNMGLWGENKAVEFLKAKNYTILARNYHSRFGEIDIIARKQNTIIFVEVKTRKNTAFGRWERGALLLIIQRALCHTLS